MATKRLTSNGEWIEVAQGDCIFQNKSTKPCFIAYADAKPEVGASNVHHIGDNDIRNLPAPLSGSIWAYGDGITIMVTDV